MTCYGVRVYPDSFIHNGSDVSRELRPRTSKRQKQKSLIIGYKTNFQKDSYPFKRIIFANLYRKTKKLEMHFQAQAAEHFDFPRLINQIV